MSERTVNPVSTTVTVRVPMKLVRRGGRKLVVPTPGEPAWTPSPRVDDVLLRALVRAFHWKRLLDKGVHATVSDLARAEKLNTSFVAHQLRLTLLAPPLVEAILDGRQPNTMQLQPLMRGLPDDWDKQVARLAGTSA